MTMLDLITDGIGRAQLADRDAVPVAQGRLPEMIKLRLLALVERTEAHDQCRHHHLGRARAAVVALHRYAEATLRQHAAIDALGTDLDEGARAKPLHHFGAEAAGAGDVPGMRRAGGPQPRRRPGALGRQAMAGAEAREAKREMLERHR